jgi:hypothetical protein
MNLWLKAIPGRGLMISPDDFVAKRAFAHTKNLDNPKLRVTSQR